MKSDIEVPSASASSIATASGSVLSSGTEISAIAKADLNFALSELSKGDMWRVYELRIAARNYNYDNYNKWMNYFVLLIGAIFVAYTSGQVEGETRIILGILGYILSILWYLSNKGFYYWIKSYMSLVHNMEEAMFDLSPVKGLTQGVYAIFDGKEKHNKCCFLSSGNISSSKVAILMAYLVAVAWFVELARQCSFLKGWGACRLLSPFGFSRFYCYMALGTLGKVLSCIRYELPRRCG